MAPSGQRPAVTTAAVLLWLGGLPAAGGVAVADVPLYGLFETAIDYRAETGSPHPYADPFYGVVLEATFLAPGGRSVPWRGFHDGDGAGGQLGDVWKIRFMPDEPGVWSYTWQFSDGSAASAAPQAFQAVTAGAKPGPLRHDPAIHQWLITADGSRHVFLNMYARDLDAYRDSVYNAPAEVVDDVRAEGFAVAFTSGPIHHLHRDSPKDGTNPWIYLDTETFTPRLEGWHLLETGLFPVLYDAEVYLYEFYGFYGGNDVIRLDRAPPEVQDGAVAYYVARTAPYYFYLYNVGFELAEFVDVPAWPVERAQFVKALDPWDHPVTMHELTTFSYPDPAYRDVIDFSAVQALGGFHSQALAIWNAGSEAHPHCNECLWNAPWQPPRSEASHRRSLWEMITGGMSAALFARDNDTGLDAFRHANRFLDGGVAWWRMAPRDELIVQGDALALADAGREYVAYVCAAPECAADFVLDLPPGDYHWQWYDPATGVESGWTALAWAGGGAPFLRPDGGDRVLWLSACVDRDADGYGEPASPGCPSPEGDCDDGDAGVHPGAGEACDGIDNDCDLAIDEGCPAGASVTLAAASSAGVVLQELEFELSGAGFGGETECTVAFGDGAFETLGQPPVFAVSILHAYATPGTFTAEASCGDGLVTEEAAATVRVHSAGRCPRPAAAGRAGGSPGAAFAPERPGGACDGTDPAGRVPAARSPAPRAPRPDGGRR